MQCSRSASAYGEAAEWRQEAIEGRAKIEALEAQLAEARKWATELRDDLPDPRRPSLPWEEPAAPKERWLVIQDGAAGIANFSNVFVVLADDEAGARVEAVRMAGMVPDAVSIMRAYRVSELREGTRRADQATGEYHAGVPGERTTERVEPLPLDEPGQEIMKRYDPIQRLPMNGIGQGEMREDPDGDWVRFDDVQARRCRTCRHWTCWRGLRPQHRDDTDKGRCGKLDADDPFGASVRVYVSPRDTKTTKGTA